MWFFFGKKSLEISDLVNSVQMITWISSNIGVYDGSLIHQCVALHGDTRGPHVFQTFPAGKLFLFCSFYFVSSFLSYSNITAYLKRESPTYKLESCFIISVKWKYYPLKLSWTAFLSSVYFSILTVLFLLPSGSISWFYTKADCCASLNYT